MADSLNCIILSLPQEECRSVWFVGQKQKKKRQGQLSRLDSSFPTSGGGRGPSISAPHIRARSPPPNFGETGRENAESSDPNPNPARQVDKISKRSARFTERHFPTCNHPAPHITQFPVLPWDHCAPYFPSSSVFPLCHLSVMSCLTSRLLPSLLVSHMVHPTWSRINLSQLNPTTNGFGTGRKY